MQIPAWVAVNDASLSQYANQIKASFGFELKSICQDYCVAFYDKFNKRVKTYKLSLNSGRCHQFDALLNFNMLVILTTKQTQDMAAVWIERKKPARR